MHPFTCETVLSWLVLIQGCAVKRLAVFALIAEVASLASALYFLLPNLYHTGVYRVDIVRARYLLAYVSFLLPLLILVPPALRLIRAGAPGLPLLASAWSWLFIDALVLLRADFHFKPFFAEPLLVMFSLAAAAVSSILLSPRTCDAAPVPDAPSRAAWMPVLLVALLAAAWFYFVQLKALHNLTFGWMDAGLYYMRVKHTALGHGFLQETLARPPFYDHFDVGLVLLVPFYYLLPRFSLIMVVQAVFLAAVGPALYVYARGRGLSCLCASLIAVAALLFPSISQLAFSFSYGFHPVTLSLPAVILSIHFWQKRRWLPFAALALFACSMEETVFPLYAGIGLVSMLAGPSRRPGALLLTLSVALFLIITKVVMPAFAGAGYFQLAKYSHLGGSFLSILSSPFTRPDVFWSLILSRQSLTFMLLLLAPLGFLPLLAPRLFFYPVVVLVFVLLLDNADVKSISFQYQTLIIAAWLPAAVAGLDRLSVFLSSRRRIGVASVSTALAFGLLVSSAFASHFYGLLPYSRFTTPFQAVRADGAGEIRKLAAAVSPSANVLATMRAATLFVDAGSVDPLQDFSPSRRYDLVVLQGCDAWGQSPGRTVEVYHELVATGHFQTLFTGPYAVLERLPDPAP